MQPILIPKLVTATAMDWNECYIFLHLSLGHTNRKFGVEKTVAPLW